MTDNVIAENSKVRFSLKRLLFSASSIMIGIGILALVKHNTRALESLIDNFEISLFQGNAIMILVLGASYALIGAGVFAPIRREVFGAIFGFVIAAIIVLAALVGHVYFTN